MMLTVVDLDSAPATPNTTALPCAEDRSKKAEDDLFAQMSCVVFMIVSRVPKLRTLLLCVLRRGSEQGTRR